MRFINAADEKVLHIGKQGENLSTAVDFSGFRNACLAAFGEGTLTLAHERAEDEGPYLILLVDAVWNVTAADVQYPGTGLAELTYRVGEVVKKTMRWKTCTLSALGAQVEPPETWQGYIDRVTALVDGIENMTVSAFPADEPTVTKSTDSEGRVHLSFGIVAGKDGHTPVKGEDYTDGKDGVGVASAARSGDSLIITLTDGTFYTIPDVRGATGPKGAKGEKGDSITGPQGAKGDKGDPGRDGITPVKGVDYFDGAPGTGIAGIVREGDSLIIILTDGTRYTIPNLRGATGPQGPKGDKGDKGDSIIGPQGPQGEPGKDAEVTAEAIESALGYTPADAADLRSPITPVYTTGKGMYLYGGEPTSTLRPGNVHSASKYATCDFLPVVPGMMLHLEGFRADALRAVCAYNRAKELVKVLAVGQPVGYVIDEVLPDDAYFIRACTDYDNTTGEVVGVITGYLYGNVAEMVVRHDSEINTLRTQVNSIPIVTDEHIIDVVETAYPVAEGVGF